MNKFTALKTTTQRLERKTFTNCRLFQRAFSHLFHTDVKTFKYELSQNMNNLEKKLNNEILHKKDSKSALTRQDFKDYTQIEAQSFKDLIIQHMESIEQCIVERARHEQEIHNRLKRLNERKLQIQECIVQKVKAPDASSGEKDYSRIVSDKGNDQEVKRDALANLIANLTLDTEENKKILKQLKKANASLTHELKEFKSNLEESNTTRDSCLIALQCKQTELEELHGL
ncbi:hypothetical protein Tco_0980930 [Tanacetum coccineum]